MRRITLQLLYFCLLLFGIGGAAYAEYEPPLQLPIPLRLILPTKKLTLQDAILLALRNNPNVQSAEIQRTADKFALEVAHNAFEPQYQFSANATYAEGANPAYSVSPQVGLLTPTGAQIQTTYNNTFVGSTGYSTTVSVTQPILKGFGPAVTLAPLRQAYYNEYNARLTLKNTVMQTITQVIQNYYALVAAYNNLEVDELALKDSQTMLKQYQIQIKAGRIAPAELVQQQSQVASQELAVTQAKNAISQSYEQLMSVLGLDPDSKLAIDQNISIDALVTPTFEQSIGLALDNNVAYQQAIFSLKNAQVGLLLAQDAQRWQLNVVASKTFGNGPSIASSGGSGSTAVGNNSVALNLNIPINNLPQQQQLVNAKVSLDQQKINLAEQKRQLQIQVIQGIQNLQFQQQQIQQAEDAVKYAQQSLDVEMTKLKFGRSTVFTVTQLQNTLINSQLNLISQQITYINTLAAYEQLVGVTLDKWGIKICY